MNAGKTVFAQLLAHLPRHEFRRAVARHRGNYRVRSFSCWDQFIAMAFAQLSGRESLRDIEACLSSHSEKLYHVGMRGKISRSTLADANERRDFRIYEKVGYSLIRTARKLYQTEELAVELDRSLYALDSTTIDLCLSLFPWAPFRKTKAAVKMHTLLDLRGSIPTFVGLTSGAVHDVNFLDVVPLEEESVVTMDRGYLDFERLYAVHRLPAFFVIRAKRNLRFRRLSSSPVDKTCGVRVDQIIALMGTRSRKDYPESLRRVAFYDMKNHRRLVFLTNLFTVSPKTVADIYKQRWQVELFFKWIKGHLRIKSFYGTSANAVKIQIWVAIIVYLLVSIAKKRLKLHPSLHTLLQIVEVNLFEKVDIIQLVTKALRQEIMTETANQLNLFGS
jgi:Transposase DDE domain.